MLWNFDYVLFSALILFRLPPSLPLLVPLQVEKVRKIGRNVQHTHETCVSLLNELHSIGFCTNLIGLILFFSFLLVHVWVVVRVQHFNTSKFCLKSWDVYVVVSRGFTLTPPHYPVIKIKCVETKRTMWCIRYTQLCIQMRTANANKNEKIDKHVWIPMNMRTWKTNSSYQHQHCSLLCIKHRTSKIEWNSAPSVEIVYSICVFFSMSKPNLSIHIYNLILIHFMTMRLWRTYEKHLFIFYVC